MSCGSTGVARNGLTVSVTRLVETTMSVEMSDSVPCSDVIKYVKVLNSVLTTLLGLIAASWEKVGLG